ncbi:MAG: oligosaccharide flippase family protein [bacterium]|nr:oligosaccharide flippase family protein [bacterium]
MEYLKKFILKFIGQNQLKRTLIKNTGFMFGGDIATKTFRLLIILILGKILSPNEYGQLFEAMAVVLVISELIDVRIGEAVTKFATDYLVKNQKNKALSIIRIGYLVDTLLGILCFCIIMLIGDIVAQKVFHGHVSSRLIKIYALSPLLSTVNGTSLAIIQTFKKFKIMSVFNALSAFARFVFPVSLVGLGLEYIMFGYVLAAFIPAVCLSVVVLKLIKTQFKGIRASNILPEMKKILPFTFHTTISVTFKSVIREMDVVLLGFFKSPEIVAYYKIALAYVNTLGFVTGPVGTVIYPTLTSLWAEKNISLYKKILRKISSVMIFVSGAGAAIIVIAGPHIFRIWKPVYLNSMPAIRVMIFAVILSNIFCWMRSTILSSGKPYISTISNMGGAIALILASFLLVPWLGLMGMAITYVLVYTAIISIALIMLRKSVFNYEF